MSWNNVFLSNPLSGSHWWLKGATISDIKRANKAIGHHWFDPDTLRFFKSRIESRLLKGDYFITSEQGPDNVRGYSIRHAKPDGSIETIGGFQAYRSKTAAMAAVKALGR